MIFNDDFSNIDWQSICEYQQARDFELQIAHFQEYDPEEKEDVEPWHDPAFIAMMEEKAQIAEEELKVLLELDF